MASRIVHDGYFVNDGLFVDEDGNPVELIPYIDPMDLTQPSNNNSNDDGPEGENEDSFEDNVNNIQDKLDDASEMADNGDYEGAI